MRKAVKVALWSGLGCPGIGHLMLKCYARGGLLLFATLCSLGYLINYYATITSTIVDKILKGEVPPDEGVIAALIDTVASAADFKYLTIARFVIVICWVIAIVDSYRIADAEENKMTSDITQ